MYNVSYNVNRLKSNTVIEKTIENCLQNCKNQLQCRIPYLSNKGSFREAQFFSPFSGKCAPVKQGIIKTEGNKKSRTQGIQHKIQQLCEIPDDFREISQENKHRASLWQTSPYWNKMTKSWGRMSPRKKTQNKCILEDRKYF